MRYKVTKVVRTSYVSFVDAEDADQADQIATDNIDTLPWEELPGGPVVDLEYSVDSKRTELPEVGAVTVKHSFVHSDTGPNCDKCTLPRKMHPGEKS